ncbi:helix-turn-helix transcriptional regulator [Pukyongiella litopenaei]|uniref:Helix-turn-helix transcriptional regulator n=1 Tax=Pukyongiella litopenaei TaxID=2605946 RepID=A0A2S0MSP9_9RHOB|nr:helix-turn-helix transcriptional regulator [Pukyongiella litopenaei]AVO38915.1 helix-turn-helix transcriptional regulator [Pukyongiella litopenaei]
MTTAPDASDWPDTLPPVIDALHSAEFFPRMTRFLGGLAPFSGIFITRLFRDAPPRHVYDTVRIERRAAVIDQYLDSAYLLDPFYDAFRKGNVDCAHRLRDVAPDRFTRSTYYQHYYRNIDLRDELGLLLALPDGSVAFYSIGRPGRERRFSSRALAAFRTALPLVTSLTAKHLLHQPRPDLPGPAQVIDDALIGFGAGVLTAREREVAELILKGHSSASISDRTGTAVGTVKIHRKNLYRKLGVSSQSELFASFLGRVLAGRDGP